MASFTGIIKTLQDLTAQTTAEDTDLIPIGTSVLKKITFANLRKALGVDALNSNMQVTINNTITLTSGTIFGVQGNPLCLRIGDLAIIQVQIEIKSPIIAGNNIAILPFKPIGDISNFALDCGAGLATVNVSQEDGLLSANMPIAPGSLSVRILYKCK